MSDSDSDFFGNGITIGLTLNHMEDNNKSKVQINSFISTQLRDAIQGMAKKDMRSFSQMVAILLEEAKEAREEENDYEADNDARRGYRP